MALAGVTILLVVADTLVATRRNIVRSVVLSVAGAIFLLTSQFLSSVVLFSGAFAPHIPLTVLAILLFPRAEARQPMLRLAAASLAAGMTCDRLPFICLAVILPLWSARRARGGSGPRDALITVLCIAVGACAARLVWTEPAVHGLAVGTRASAAGWVNTSLLRFRSVPWERLRFAMAVLLNRSTLALSALFAATAILLRCKREELSQRYPAEHEKAVLSWIVGFAFLATGVALPEMSLIACAAFVAPAVLSTRILGRWMLARMREDGGMEWALGFVLVAFQLGAGFWPVAAVGGMLRHPEQETHVESQVGEAGTAAPVGGLE